MRSNQARKEMPTAHVETDGRRRRGNTSRARIVEAMLKLVRDGNVAPGAARVADLAGVSLRTVFRHFEEMDSLYREMGETIQARVLPALFRPYTARSWRDRLVELIDRRIEVFEFIMPFKISAELRRFQSDYIAKDAEQHLNLERMSMESVVPKDVADDAPLLSALLAATGFQAWRILRQDLDLPIDDARAAMMRAVDALLASSPAARTKDDGGAA
jgi:AcrR family transcriptional regulator